MMMMMMKKTMIKYNFIIIETQFDSSNILLSINLNSPNLSSYPISRLKTLIPPLALSFSEYLTMTMQTK